MQEVNSKLKQAKDLKNNRLYNTEEYPNNLICLVRIKINQIKGEEKIQQLVGNGSGCLIHDNLLLTAAHNLQDRATSIKRLTNLKRDIEDNSYISQTCPEGQSKVQYTIKDVYQSDKFEKDRIYDYALVQIEPKVKEERYPAIVALTPEAARNLKGIEIVGNYLPIKDSLIGSQMTSSQFKGASKMAFPCHSQGLIKKYQQVRIIYDNISTDKGLSGSPIFTEYQNEKIIIGIHKGSQIGKENPLQSQNFGISATIMIEELNQLGYKLLKRPLVYTQKTLRLRKKDWMHNLPQSFLMDRMYQSLDMLVITAFDLSKIRKLYLSGNRISNAGVQYLLRREYPNLECLFLTSNQIDDLSKIPENNWKNIFNIRTLSLNSNQLISIPNKFSSFPKMAKLFLIDNYLKDIPPCLIQLSKRLQDKLTVYIYKNKIVFQGQNKQKRDLLSKYRSLFIWQSQHDNN